MTPKEYEEFNFYRIIDMPPKYVEGFSIPNVDYLFWWLTNNTPIHIEKIIGQMKSNPEEFKKYENRIEEEEDSFINDKKTIGLAQIIIARNDNNDLQTLLQNPDHDRYITPNGRMETYNLYVRMITKAQMVEDLKNIGLMKRDRFIHQEHYIPPTSKDRLFLSVMYMQLYGE